MDKITSDKLEHGHDEELKESAVGPIMMSNSSKGIYLEHRELWSVKKYVTRHH